MVDQEDNEVNWQGVIPATDPESFPVYPIKKSDDTQQCGNSGADNGWTTLYTVPAGKTLYLTSTVLQCHNNSGARGVGYLAVTDNVPTLQYAILYADLPNGGYLGFNNTFFPPLEIPATWLLRIYSSAVGVYTSGVFSGFTR